MEEVLLVAIVALYQFFTAVFTLFNDAPSSNGTREEDGEKMKEGVNTIQKKQINPIWFSYH
jgi:hypothetical protein